MQKATALSTAQYGLLELANTLVILNLFLVAAALGVPAAINRCCHQDCGDEFTLVWLILAQLTVIPFELPRTSGRPHLHAGLSVTRLVVQKRLHHLSGAWPRDGAGGSPLRQHRRSRRREPGGRDRPRAPRRLEVVTTCLAAALAFSSLAICLAVPPFLRISASADFQAASGVVPERLRPVAAYAAFAAVINIDLNALLIPWMGMWGAAVATVLAFAVHLAGSLWSLRRCYPVDLEWRRRGGIAVAGCAPLAASWMLPSLPILADIAARLVRSEELATAARGVVWVRGRFPGPSPGPGGPPASADA